MVNVVEGIEDIEELSLKVGDNRSVAVTRFRSTEAASETLLIAPALGVPQRFYKPFVKKMVGKGFNVVTFDYRGIGRSKPERYRGFNATMEHWIDDYARVIDWTFTQNENRPVRLFCHSVSGQLLAAIPNQEKIAAAVSLTAGSGYYKLNTAKPWTIRAFWFGIVPLSMAFAGYYPGRKIGIMDDLPHGIMKRWREWCLHPRYLLDPNDQPIENGFRTLTAPILAFSFTDDWMISGKAVADLNNRYPGATHFHLSPEIYDLKQIGHFGFFKNDEKIQQFWDHCVDWLKNPVDASIPKIWTPY